MSSAYNKRVEKQILWTHHNQLHTLPEFDKIKSEYPPYVDALNNLKLPPKPDLEGLVKL